MKKVFKTTILTLIFSYLIFGMRVAMAQVSPDIDDNNNDNNINDNVNDDEDEDIIDNNDDNDFNDNNNLNNENNDTDVVDELDDDNNLGEILTYGLGGALLGGLVTYFAIRERKTT